MTAPRVLGKARRLTQSALRNANAEAVGALRGGDSEVDFGDKWGVSPATVGNTHNKRHDLSQQNFLRLGEQFGPAGVNKQLALVDLVAFPRSAVDVDLSKVPLDVASALPLLMELLSDGECCARDLRALEDAGVAEKLIKIGDFLRQRRAEPRSVSAG